MKRLLGMLLLVCVVLAMTGTPAQAVLITNGATTLVDESFESYTDLPAVLVSPWTYTEIDTSVVKVIDDASPGAYTGSQYLKIQRNSTNVTEATVNFDSQTTGTVTLEVAIYLENNSGTYGQIKLPGYGLVFGPTFDNVIKVYNDGWTSTGLAWTSGTWNTLEIDYVPGATQLTITLNDGTPTTVTTSTTDAAISDIEFTVNNGATMYVDAVIPEPATMGLLAVGGLGVLIRRRRK